MDRVAHGASGVMVWAGICYGQRAQVHFIYGILKEQRYRDEILRPIVVPFIHDHIIYTTIYKDFFVLCTTGPPKYYQYEKKKQHKFTDE